VTGPRRQRAEEYGGGGGGLVELAIVCEEIANQGTPLLLLLVSAAISAEVIGEFGSPELRKEWLPGLANGRTKVVFAITEPNAGSNTHRLATTATRDGDGWVLRGTKHYISGVDEAAALMVVARSGRGADGRRCSLFVVPTDAPGLVAHAAARRHPVARTSSSCSTRSTDAPAAEAVVGRGRGLPTVFHGSTRSGSPGGAWRRRRPLRTAEGGRVRLHPACGRRSGPSGRVAHPSPRRRSRPSWPR
jgi:alkylation response protein AidB-like acyl-CoA dehydrogenase